jgi:hypothetical protein
LSFSCYNFYFVFVFTALTRQFQNAPNARVRLILWLAANIYMYLASCVYTVTPPVTWMRQQSVFDKKQTAQRPDYPALCAGVALNAAELDLTPPP